MVKDSELLDIAQGVYKNHKKDEEVEFNYSKSKWIVLGVLENKSNGFYGEAYYRKKNNSDSYDIVVALRGSDEKKDFYLENANLIKWDTLQYNSSKILMDDTLQKVDNLKLTVNSLYVTGHSLGGKLAQQLFFDYYSNKTLRTKYKISEAVVFNSAPTRDSKNHVKYDSLPTRDPDFLWNVPVRHYAIEGEILNSKILNETPGVVIGGPAQSYHFGKTYRLPFSHEKGAPDDLLGIDRHNAWDTFKYYIDENGFINPHYIRGRTANDYLQGSVGQDILIGGKGTSYLNGGGGNDTYKYFRGSGIYILTEGGPRGPGAGIIKIYDYDLKEISFKVYKVGSSLCLEIYFDGKKTKLIKVEDISGRNSNKIQLITIENSKKLYSINVRTLLEYYSIHGKDKKKLPKNKEMPISQLPKDVLIEIGDLSTKDNNNKKEVKVSSASGEKLSYVVAGATMQCSCGNLPRKLKASYSHGVYIKDKAKLNVMDYRPNENIAPFGMCSSPGNPQVVKEGRPVPCKPIVTTPWIYGKEDVLVENYPALLHISQNSCLHKGLIRFVDNGQVEKR